MYILSAACRRRASSRGCPTVLGWSGGVADVDRGPQFARAQQRLRRSAAGVVVPVVAAARGAGERAQPASAPVAARQATPSATGALRGGRGCAGDRARLPWREDSAADCAVRAGRGDAARVGSLRRCTGPHRCGIPCGGWGICAPRRSSSCSARVPAFATLERGDLERIAEVAVPRELRARAARVPRGRRQRHLLRRARRPRPRDPQPQRRAHDHAGHLRPRGHLRRARDVRGRAPLGDGRSDRADHRRGRARAATCAG